MAFRSVMHSHPCRNFPPVTVTALDSLPILPDSALAIPRHPADLSFFDQAVSVRGRDSVMGKAVPAVADSVVADYSSPAVDLAFVGPGFDPGFVAVRLVTVAAAVAVVVVVVA